MLVLDYVTELVRLHARDVVVVLLVLLDNHIPHQKIVLKEVNLAVQHLVHKVAKNMVVVQHVAVADVQAVLLHALEVALVVVTTVATLLVMETVGKARVKETVQEHAHTDVLLVAKRSVIIIVTLVAVEIV